MVRKIIRKNILLLRILRLFISLFFWGCFVYVLFFVYPQSIVNYYYLPMLIPLFLAIIFTLNIFISILFSSIIALGILAIVIIRIYLIKDIINPILISSLVITLIYFFTTEKRGAKLQNKINSIDQSQNNNTLDYANIEKTNQTKFK